MEGVINSLAEAMAKPEGGGWRSTVFDLDALIGQPEPLVSIGGQMVLSRGNIVVVSGRSKSGKSTILSAMVSAALSGVEVIGVTAPRPLRVLLADTEQGAWHLSAQCARVFRLAGGRRFQDRFTVLALREYSPAQRASIIFDAARELKPDLVVIDGIGDMLKDCNDLAESEETVSGILSLSSELNTGILSVLHTTPSLGKLRGHLGSSLERKAETVISLERDGMTADEVEVKPGLCRNKPFPAFNFKFGENGDPEIVTHSSKPETARDWVVFLMQPHREYTNSELLTMLAGCERKFNRNSAQYGITQALRGGHIIKLSNGRYVVRLRNQEQIFNDENEDETTDTG